MTVTELSRMTDGRRVCVLVDGLVVAATIVRVWTIFGFAELKLDDGREIKAEAARIVDFPA